MITLQRAAALSSQARISRRFRQKERALHLKPAGGRSNGFALSARTAVFITSTTPVLLTMLVAVAITRAVTSACRALHL
jgi:hypothetical protein